VKANRAVPRFWAHPLVRAALAMVILGVLSVAVLRLAVSQRQAPKRCPPGMATAGERCCGVGQQLQAGACSGRAHSCSAAQDASGEGQCVARFGVVSLPGGELFIGAADWEAQTGAERFPRTRVAPFRIDMNEVTVERYRNCAACVPVTGEPGAPVAAVTAQQAEAFCASQRGRLPTAAEWVWAAAGSAARRYAWGNSGLVCRRAAFGLSDGPCSKQGMPELCGSRPEGASPEGVLDLTGNVAEWTREANGGFAARGGSFRSTAAAELKSWAAEACCSGKEAAPHIGFRCAYPP
jgi:formylglycine-generating enzyme